VTFSENIGSSTSSDRSRGQDWSVLERRNYMARPFSTVTDKNAQLLRNEHARINAERKSRGLGKLLLKDLAVKWKTSPGLVSQYYRGHEPLNTKWKMRFAEWMGVSPVKVWPDFEHKTLVTNELSPEMAELVKTLADNFDEDQIDALKALVAATMKKRKG